MPDQNPTDPSLNPTVASQDSTFPSETSFATTPTPPSAMDSTSAPPAVMPEDTSATFTPPPSDSAPPPPVEGSDLPPAPPIVESAGQETGGSAAPAFDIDSSITPPSTPKKKFGGKRVIATILGILVLIGGLGAGIILVQQQQDIRQRAAEDAGGGSTTPYCTRLNQQNCLYGCEPTTTGGRCKSAPTTAPSPCPSGKQCQGIANQNECVLNRNGTWQSCSGAGGTGTGIGTCCVPAGATTTPTCQTGQVLCNNVCTDTRYDSRSCGSCGNACPSGQRCWESKCVTTTTTQACPSGYSTGGSNRDAAEEACEGVCGTRETPTANRICENGTIVNAGTATIPNWCYKCSATSGYCDRSAPNTADCTDVREGSACTIRPSYGGGSGTCKVIDGQLGANTECQCQSGSGGGVTTTISPTSPPPPPPGVTAQCLNIKAYDTNWVGLTNDQLKSLKAGDKVRFAVAGTATSGSFDKAKFKINGTERPEVTTKKSGSEEFYDEYTIPEGITTFTINAQIHHSTLGWSN